MTETSTAGAMPVADGATPSQTPVPPAPPALTAPTTPATGTPDADGLITDAGRETLRKERDRADKAERELAKLQRSTQTDTERAITDAKAAGVTETTERFHGQIRRAEIRSALTGAGINASVLDLAAKADEFAALKVNDEGDVTGLEAAVDAFKRARPDLFAAKVAPRQGTAGLGPQGTPATGGTDLNTWIRKEAGRA